MQRNCLAPKNYLDLNLEKWESIPFNKLNWKWTDSTALHSSHRLHIPGALRECFRGWNSQTNILKTWLTHISILTWIKIRGSEKYMFVFKIFKRQKQTPEKHISILLTLLMTQYYYFTITYLLKFREYQGKLIFNKGIYLSWCF